MRKDWAGRAKRAEERVAEGLTDEVVAGVARAKALETLRATEAIVVLGVVLSLRCGMKGQNCYRKKGDGKTSRR